ncbi:MAG: peroxide stress protein YaaA [Oribacterium sp.]|nr:peroxide stress protein YaaA [Oribacterium sp.]MBO6206968.1 peroxide stress protein YaaA [Lachnospiraceae bacterium]MBP3802648.1 peroxide stress protein YaaA [Oribacterium sp.]
MKIIISPAKKMNMDTDKLDYKDIPVFLEQTEYILSWLRDHSLSELQKLWGCNEKIAKQNYERIRNMDLRSSLTPAIISYEGLAYQYMAPAVFERSSIDYVQEHLRILSGFYGVLKPLDGVTPYRLEMQAKAAINSHKDLYELWGKRLYNEVRDETGIIINLASKEYSKCIEKYLRPDDTFITVTFGETANGKLVTKGTYAKMARGEMVRFMAENMIEDPNEIKTFDRLGYVFMDELSNSDELVFERRK